MRFLLDFVVGSVVMALIAGIFFLVAAIVTGELDIPKWIDWFLDCLLIITVSCTSIVMLTCLGSCILSMLHL